uniref:NADH-ubiquinone oxidoreductase chain 6 n=1 Tax=Scutigerella causeyae TaxID=388540 RepID=Q06RF6_9MYRI|nr:NADH dehydrogenase subunit 6 [Scutigerella causeyae]ABF93311.1 NADH dehydrogenase subunit 6 [Scutigerella causeyae]
MILSLILVFFSALIMKIKHPVPMGITLILSTFFTALISLFFMNSPWFSYILFLITIGGVLILFLYMTSLISSEEFPMKNVLFSFLLMLTFVLLSTPITSNNSFYSNKSMFFMFSSYSISMVIFLALYLLMALIIVVFITKTNKGPLRFNP